jgi:uncharacterized protein YbjT (DUF2867 family)
VVPDGSRGDRLTTLLVVGATGLVGTHVLEQALEDARISSVIALTRRPIASQGMVVNVFVDFSNLPGHAPWWSVFGVISAMGTTRAVTKSQEEYRAIDFEYPLAVARHARAHGARSFALTSSLGADPESRFFYTRTKGELESELKKLVFPSLTIVQPSVLEGDRKQQRTGERIYQNALKLLAPIVPRRLQVSPASAVAASLIHGVVEAPPGVHLVRNENMRRPHGLA